MGLFVCLRWGEYGNDKRHVIVCTLFFFVKQRNNSNLMYDTEKLTLFVNNWISWYPRLLAARSSNTICSTFLVRLRSVRRRHTTRYMREIYLLRVVVFILMMRRQQVAGSNGWLLLMMMTVWMAMTV